MLLEVDIVNQVQILDEASLISFLGEGMNPSLLPSAIAHWALYIYVCVCVCVCVLINKCLPNHLTVGGGLEIIDCTTYRGVRPAL